MATINLSQAEMAAGVKGIIPQTDEGTILQDKNRRFRRVRHSPDEKLELASKGFQHVLSSNVSAVARDGDDLIIRFHGGNLYRYQGQGDKIGSMLKSNSKGKWVWNNLIRKNVAYTKEGMLKLKSELTTQETAQILEKGVKERSILDRVVEGVNIATKGAYISKALGLEFNQIVLGGLKLNILNAQN